VSRFRRRRAVARGAAVDVRVRNGSRNLDDEQSAYARRPSSPGREDEVAFVACGRHGRQFCQWEVSHAVDQEAHTTTDDNRMVNLCLPRSGVAWRLGMVRTYIRRLRGGDREAECSSA